MTNDSLYEEIDELRADASNDQVDDLLDVIEKLAADRDRLAKRCERLEDRLTQVERHVGVVDEDEISATSPRFDKRDRRVLSALAERNPDEVSLKDLQRFYRRTTDIRNSKTLSDRIRVLVEDGPFEETDQMREWRYVG